MTRLLTRCFLLATVLFLFSIASCDKDKTTTVNVKVLDNKTGEPIAGAYASIRISHDENQPPNNIEFKSVDTDEKGEFSFSHSKPFQIYDVNRGGYLKKGIGSNIPIINQGEINEVTIQLIPKD